MNNIITHMIIIIALTAMYLALPEYLGFFRTVILIIDVLVAVNFLLSEE